MKKPKKHAGGRPTAYKPEYAKQAERLCLLGCTNEELAVFFDVAPATIYVWYKAHPEFLESLKKGRVVADGNVAASLYKRACGYTLNDHHYPPDTAAAFIWLKNRQSGKWRDRHELTGPEGGPLLVKINYPDSDQ